MKDETDILQRLTEELKKLDEALNSKELKEAAEYIVFYLFAADIDYDDSWMPQWKELPEQEKERMISAAYAAEVTSVVNANTIEEMDQVQLYLDELVEKGDVR